MPWTHRVLKAESASVDIARMLIGAALLFCILSVPLTGGRLSRLADLEFRRAWLALAAIVVQVLIISILPGVGQDLSEQIHLASYLLLGAFLVVNRHVPGLLVIAAGGALNFAAIATNGGVMPADPDAIAAAGIPQNATEFANSAPADGAPLGFLGDVFHTPGWLPIHNVFSVGDLVIVLGAFLLLHRASGTRLGRRTRRLRTAEA
ncbi:MAG: hypothetical protein QOC68_2818 [Solirubrobacteraceae bacterium]|jgi:hypothetical protein|nr:hypothetical protein [Solirubrobacteraceae bacterium]